MNEDNSNVTEDKKEDQIKTDNNTSSGDNAGMAIASMVLGIVALVFSCCLWYITIPGAVVGLVLAIISLKKEKPGRGMAIAGLVCNIIAIVAMICCIIFGGIGGKGDSTSKKDNSTAKSSSEATSQKEADKDDSSSEEQKEESSEESSEQEEGDAPDKIYGVGDTIDADGLKITFKKCYTKKRGEYTKPDKGNIFLIIDVVVKNDSKYDADVSSANFDAYADDTAVETYYMDSDLGVKSLSASLSPGKKATGSLTYEVPKNFKKITLECEPNIFSLSDDKYIFEYTK